MSGRAHAIARRRGVRWWALAVLLVALAGACRSADGSEDITPTTVRRTSTTGLPQDATSEEVSAAYKAANQAFIDAGEIPDPQLPALAATHVDPMLEQSRKIVRSLQLGGRVARYPNPSKYRVEVDEPSIAVDGDVVRFDACMVDDGQIVEAASGRVLNDRVSTVHWRVAMRRVVGAWRLAEQKKLEEWEGVAGCALD